MFSLVDLLMQLLVLFDRPNTTTSNTRLLSSISCDLDVLMEASSMHTLSTDGFSDTEFVQKIEG